MERSKFSAELWCSHKDLGNDDCITGSDHETRDEAADALEQLKAHPAFAEQWAYACIEGPNGRTHAAAREIAVDADDDDASEAMMQGMAFGIDGYNEARGFDVEDSNERSDLRP